MSVRALLFDFDGLILDTETAELVAWKEVWAEYGYEFPVARFMDGIGTVGGFGALAALDELAGPLDREGVVAQQSARRLALIELEEIRPGVIDYLQEARDRDLKTAVVSSSSDEWIALHLTRLGSSELFDVIVCGNHDRSRSKPQPTLFIEALSELGIEAREAVAFEDSPQGVRAAKAAGIYCVAVPSVTSAAALSEADIVVRSLAELPIAAVLDRLAGV